MTGNSCHQFVRASTRAALPHTAFLVSCGGQGKQGEASCVARLQHLLYEVHSRCGTRSAEPAPGPPCLTVIFRQSRSPACPSRQGKPCFLYDEISESVDAHLSRAAGASMLSSSPWRIERQKQLPCQWRRLRVPMCPEPPRLATANVRVVIGSCTVLRFNRATICTRAGRFLLIIRPAEGSLLASGLRLRRPPPHISCSMHHGTSSVALEGGGRLH